MPEAILIAGANGAGKTTFARVLLPALYPDVEFLNVDEVQAEGFAFAHPVAAGREVLRRLGEAERRRESFAIETTLSSTMYARRMRSWKTWGYRLAIHFIEVPSDDFAVRRVAMRVAAGGHSVPEVDIRRRYHRGLALFEQVYIAARRRVVSLVCLVMTKDFALDSTRRDDPGAPKLAVFLEAARRATWDALHGPRHLRTGRFLRSPSSGHRSENAGGAAQTDLAGDRATPRI